MTTRWLWRSSDWGDGVPTLSEVSMASRPRYLTDAQYRSLVPPSYSTALDCSVCRGCSTIGTRICQTCDLAIKSLGNLVPVVPISLYAKPSELRNLLTYYKPGREHLVPT